MKKDIVVILALCITIITLTCGSLNVSAASYVEKVITEDFASKSDCEFLAPGDMNTDGNVNNDDLILLKKLLLSNTGDKAYTAVYKANSKTAKYSDINGDKFVDIRDLVRQENNSAQNSAFISNGVMTLNGNSAFTGTFNSALVKNAVYEVSVTYKSNSPITIRMADLNKEIVFDAVSKTSTVTKTFETSATITDTDGIEFQIIGTATVDSITVNRTNIDNDIVDNW